MNPALVIIVVIACLVAIGVGLYFLLKKQKPDSDSAEVADLEVPLVEVPAFVEDPLPALEDPLLALPAMVLVDGLPVVSPSDPIAPVSPEPMAATTWADDLTTMPAEIPVEASTAELDLARADPTAGLFPSTADLKAQDQGAQQVAPVDAPAPAPAPTPAPVFAPAPAEAETKAKGCGGTRIWDPTLRVCRERSVKPAAAAAKLDVPPVTIAPVKSKGCGPGKIWDGKACRAPKGPAPEGGADARKAARDAEKRSRDESGDDDESNKKCKLGNTAKYDYTPKIESSPNQYDWHCPSGYKSTGCSWSDLPDGTEARHCRKRKTSSTAKPKSKWCGNGKIWDGKVCRAPKDPSSTAKPKSKLCGNGKIWDGKVCRAPKDPSPTTPNAPPGQPVAEGSKAWNDTAAYRAARQNEQRAKVEGPAPSPPPGSGGCPPGKSRDPKTKDCRPTAGLEARRKKVADAANIRAVQREGRYISNSGKGRSPSEIAAEVARRGGDWSD